MTGQREESRKTASEEEREDVDALRAEIWGGLRRSQKEISSRFFYDTAGSELFEEITRLPEYYPTRTERALLEAWSPGLVDRYRPAALLELGAGSADKTRLLLDAMDAREEGGVYLPLDVSVGFLAETADALRREYPGLEIRPVVADLTDPVDPDLIVPRPLLLAFLGSTIGNFDEGGAVEILRHVSDFFEPGDRFLMGADLRPSPGKTVEELEAAYNDARGVTAEFNRNALRVLNHRAGTDFDPASFAHRAFYDPEHGRIEMHLVAERPQAVTVPGWGQIAFREGESLRTEISCKYDRLTVERLFRRASLRLEAWITDPRERYALAVGRPA